MGAQPDRAARIFDAAVDLGTPAERAAYLDAACGENLQLRAEVAELLKHDDAAGSFLDLSTPSDPQGTTDGLPVSECPGTVIGPYKLLEQIGEGGFGIVFMAEQMQPVHRKIALKIIKPGMDTRQVVARFEAERQALALMDHPNIAHVFDGGTTASGRPYFVMELVKGAPITEFCDYNQLTPRQRLELFVSVCQAVQHAHQKGIIHRDLKPSNVLVTVHDTTPVVKVIDFGVAKALGQELTDKTLVTGFAQIIGTPLYMSPEQAGQSGLDMDTRSDIYSLGVLLYELLTGTTPFEKERFRTASYEEICRIIQQEEPPRPSTRISTLGQAASAMALKRQSDPKRLRQLVRGELDWIVMKCLEKDRSRRYETANGLAMDVQRYLRDEPVLACPPSAWYRFRKFVRRNKAPLAVIGLILFCIISIGIGSGWVLRDRAARDYMLNRGVNDALDEAERLIESAKWLEAAAAVERAQKLLTAAGRQDAPARLAELQKDLALAQRLEDIYSQPKTEDFVWGREADTAYAEAFANAGIDLANLSAAEAAERIKARGIWRELVRALDLWSFMRHRCELQTQAGGPATHRPTWKQLTEIAAAADPDPLRNQLRQARQRGDRKALVAGAASADVGQLPPESLLQLTTALDENGAKEEAMALARRALLVHPGDFWLNNYLGWWCLKAQPPQYDDAIRYYTASWSLRPRNPYTVNALGDALAGKKAYTEAISLFSRAIELKPDYAQAWSLRSSAYRALHQYDKALADMNKAMELDANNALLRNNLAWFLTTCPETKLRDASKAVALAQKAVALAPKAGMIWNTLGAAHYRAGNCKEALATLEKSMELRNGGNSFDWFFLAMTYWQLGEKEKSRAWFDRAVQWMDKNQPKDEELGRFREEAEELLQIKKK